MKNRKLVNITTGEVSTLYRLGRQHLRDKKVNITDKKVLKQLGLNIIKNNNEWVLKEVN